MSNKQLNKQQEAELNSFRATEAHVDANITVINGIAAFMTTYNQIKANNASIIQFEQEKSAALTGIATNKTNLRAALSEETLTISGLVSTYADDIADEQLRAEMNITRTIIRRKRDDELAPFCQFVHDRASAIDPATLKNYNLTTAKLAEYQTLITSYQTEVPKPRLAISNRKTTNTNLAALFKNNRKLFEKFDKQIESLRESNSDFVNTYFTTRNIIEPTAKSKKSPEGGGKEGNNNLPL